MNTFHGSDLIRVLQSIWDALLWFSCSSLRMLNVYVNWGLRAEGVSPPQFLVYPPVLSHSDLVNQNEVYSKIPTNLSEQISSNRRELSRGPLCLAHSPTWMHWCLDFRMKGVIASTFLFLLMNLANHVLKFCIHTALQSLGAIKRKCWHLKHATYFIWILYHCLPLNCIFCLVLWRTIFRRSAFSLQF